MVLKVRYRDDEKQNGMKLEDVVVNVELNRNEKIESTEQKKKKNNK